MPRQELRIPAGSEKKEEITIDSGELFVQVGKNAKLQLIVYIKATDDSSCSMDVHVEDDAYCTILTINTAGALSKIAVSQRGEIGENASLHWQNITLGGKEVMHDLVSRVVGSDSESAVDWMFYAKGNEKYLLKARNVFDGRNGKGEILMRGVAEETGHAKAEGMIEIGLKGGGTNTYLTQNVLMLDKTAKVDAIPGLEIKTNDVKASHSATVSRLTDEDLFYFGSRSIAPREARAMYVQGFLADITQRISDVDMRKTVTSLIEEKYGN